MEFTTCERCGANTVVSLMPCKKNPCPMEERIKALKEKFPMNNGPIKIPSLHDLAAPESANQPAGDCLNPMP